jgi:hypothetical protein
MSDNKFRFASKEEYEEEMIKLIKESKSDKEDYDILVEEYVRFCESSGENDV